MNRSKLLAPFACLIALTIAGTASSAPREPSEPSIRGFAVSFYSSNTTAIAPVTAQPEYGDVWGGQLEYDGVLGRNGWGYYGAGSFGTGSEKFTGAVTSIKGTFTDWDVQAGLLWTAILARNWYLGYGPAAAYWSGKVKEETTGGSLPSETGKNFNSFGVGGRLMFGSSAPGLGVQGSITNFIGWGSGTDGSNKLEETNHRWQYCIGIRHSF